MSTVLNCPFCGGKVRVVPCDDEGNLHLEDDYEKHPWSGLGYKLLHTDNDVPIDKTCPIATYEEDDTSLGVYTYDSKEEAVSCWKNIPLNNYKNSIKEDLILMLDECETFEKLKEQLKNRFEIV